MTAERKKRNYTRYKGGAKRKKPKKEEKKEKGVVSKTPTN
jgi:hypothetical protein